MIEAYTSRNNEQRRSGSRWQAIQWGLTRRMYCRVAHSPILTSTLSNAYLKRLGYVSFRERISIRRGESITVCSPREI